MTAANALLTAITGRLAGDATLTAAIGPDAIHDRLIPRSPLPYLVIGEIESRDYSTASEAGEEHFVAIEVWADGQGRRVAVEIAARVRVLLHDAPLTLAGFALVSLLHRTTRVRRPDKTRLHVAEIGFRAVTE